MVSVSLTVAPLVTGVIHVMANPKLSYSTSGIIESGKRAFPTPPPYTAAKGLIDRFWQVSLVSVDDSNPALTSLNCALKFPALGKVFKHVENSKAWVSRL